MSDLTWYVIYKTTHVVTDQYYVGRHQTTDLDDGYQGSGNWVRSFEDTSVLETEVIEYCENSDHLKEREQHYIDLWFDDPLCMNESRASDGGTIKGTPAHARLIEVTSSLKYREKMSKAQLMRYEDPERRAKQSDIWTEEWRKSQSQRMIDHFRNLENRNRQADLARNRWSDPAERKAQSTRISEYYKDPQRRESMTERACRHYYIITVVKSNEQIPVRNLSQWAKNNHASTSCLARVADGERKSHKGLTCRKVSKEEYEALLKEKQSPPSDLL